MQIGVIADDLTGAVDALLQARRHGLTATMVTDPADLDEAPGDVVVLAGTYRAMPTAELVLALRPVLTRFRDSGARVIHYKACSTGDSAPTIGSLGAVIEEAREIIGARPVPVLLAQPDFGRYTVFATHFARDGDAIHRLDRHPTMSEHPITPMREADLRRHLADQTTLPIGGFSVTDYERGADHLVSAIEHGDPVMVFDALTMDHVRQFGHAVLSAGSHPDDALPRFVVGSGAVTAALATAIRATTTSESAPTPPNAAPAYSGAVLALSGSASPLTSRQLAASGWPILAVDDPRTPERASTLLASSEPVAIAVTGPHQLTALAELARQLAPSAGRIVICGGDSSGVLLHQLGVTRLEILAQPWENLPLLRAAGTGSAFDDRQIILKGGQMGDDRILTRIAADGLTDPDQEPTS